MAADARLEWLRGRAAPLLSEGGSELVFDDEQAVLNFLNECMAVTRIALIQIAV